LAITPGVRAHRAGPVVWRMIDSCTSGPARLGQAEFAESRTRIGKLSEKDLDVALELAHDSGLALAATERVRALILEVFEDKSGSSAP
jgi:hypothetical protein